MLGTSNFMLQLAFEFQKPDETDTLLKDEAVLKHKEANFRILRKSLWN